MTRTVSVSEAKNKLSAMMEWAIKHREGVIVESRGQPKAVIVSIKEYRSLLALREKERRREALQQLEALATRVQARNDSLSSEEAERLADEITRETIEHMTEEGSVRFRS